MSNSDTMTRVYQDAQAACGLKVGDWVKVTKKAPAETKSLWSSWTPQMDATIGKTGRIREIAPNYIGVKFDEKGHVVWAYPYFALEKVEKPAPVFKSYNRVLVRDSNDNVWRCAWFSHIDTDGFFVCTSGYWKQCIPYEGNEHLCGTTDAPEE